MGLLGIIKHIHTNLHTSFLRVEFLECFQKNRKYYKTFSAYPISTSKGAARRRQSLVPCLPPWTRPRLLNPTGCETLKHVKQALRRECVLAKCVSSDDYDDDDHFSWTPPVNETPDDVRRWQNTLLRRYGLLILIFFVFGAYEAYYFTVRR